MAAAARKMVGESDDSSSSDDEALRRCQEAVWETRTDKKKDGDRSVQQSKRVVVADHELDGNELQVTQGFRTHVARKLGHFLDSYITEAETSSCVKSAKCDDGDEDEVPGQAADDPPAPVRRRPVPSSSDSDSEMETRLKEAAVSVKDLLPSTPLPSAAPTPSAQLPCSGKIKKREKLAEGEESHVVKKKKKKKRKPNQEESDSAGSLLNAQSNGEHGSSEQEHTQVKVKRKKKREGNTEEEALD